LVEIRSSPTWRDAQAAAEDDRFAMDLMVRHGIPEDVTRALGSLPALVGSVVLVVVWALTGPLS